MKTIDIIGGGLAGCEAAYQIARLSAIYNIPCSINLYEMRPIISTGAHHTEGLAELVCSNSLGNISTDAASGLLKAELSELDSLIIKSAKKAFIAAGNALAVDRDVFSKSIEETLSQYSNIRIIREPRYEPNPDNITIIASGPLTEPKLAKWIQELIKADNLFFFDAAAPIIYRESIDMDRAFLGNRYNKGEGHYINCPMTKDEYLEFYNALISAEKAPVKDFEKGHFFESCLPVEEIARRGVDTLRYGPMKPVGLEDPVTDKRYYAVLQLRQDNSNGSLYNLVGCQTQLKWGEQKRVFSLIPALKNAEFARYGVMHKNLFIDATKSIYPTMQSRANPNIFFAGQICGVEGYTESSAMGLVAGTNAFFSASELPLLEFPDNTIIGGLARYITDSTRTNIQPINSNWGLLQKEEVHKKNKKEYRKALAEKALGSIKVFSEAVMHNKQHECLKCMTTKAPMWVEDPNIPDIWFCDTCYEERRKSLQYEESGYLDDIVESDA